MSSFPPSRLLTALGSRTLLGIVLAVLLLILSGSSLLSCARGTQAQNLLAGRQPVEAKGVSTPGVLTDGKAAQDGDHWRTELTATFSGPSAYVVFDLGQPTSIEAAYLQGDNNDEYVLSVSADGQTYRETWIAGPVKTPGQQPRSKTGLEERARFIKVAARRGDRSFSVSEIQVFAEQPTVFPPNLHTKRGLPAGEAVRSQLLLFALALVGWLFLTRRGAWRWAMVLGLLPLLAGVSLCRTLYEFWPLGGREVALVRGLSAGIAGLAVLREVLLPKLFPASRVSVMGTLATTAVAAFMGFYNLGHPQFEDQAAKQPLFVHNFDMRVYYPVAKYFKELRFDGLYMASVAAYIGDDPSVTLDSPQIARAQLRNLRDHRMTTVAEVRGEIERIPQRFSAARWEAFKTDMRYFRETMGVRDYLGSMRDHGGNATPVWLAIAHVIFAKTAASNSTLFYAGLLDPLLILVALGFIGRAFGPRTLLISAVVFGANDFYMFGSNWGGATLRHDWMAYLAIGLSALKLRWWTTGGVFLALSALIRAFPATALLVLVFPVLWWVYDYRKVHGKPPSLGLIWNVQQPFFRVALGATSCVVVFVLFSSLLFSFDAWTEWLAKVRLLDRDPHVNHISLRSLVAGSGHLQHSILRARLPVFAAGILLFLGGIALLGRRAPLYQVATAGTLLIAVAFNPANYYIHFILVLPLLAQERDGELFSRLTPRVARRSVPAVSRYDAAIWGALLALCAAQYWPTWITDTEIHFQFHTVLYFAFVTPILAFLLWRDWDRVTAESSSFFAGTLNGSDRVRLWNRDPAVLTRGEASKRIARVAASPRLSVREGATREDHERPSEEPEDREERVSDYDAAAASEPVTTESRIADDEDARGDGPRENSADASDDEDHEEEQGDQSDQAAAEEDADGHDYGSTTDEEDSPGRRKRRRNREQ